MSNELSNIKEESLIVNGSCTNKTGKCEVVSDSGGLIMDQTIALDNANKNKEITDCVEELTDKISEEMEQDSNSGVDIEKCSESISNVRVSATDSNFENKSDTVKEIILVRSDKVVGCTNDESNNASEVCLNIKLNDPISITELGPPSSEVFDESLSEEEVYVEIDDEESDLNGEKSGESQEGKDINSHSMSENVSGSFEANDLLNENNRNEKDVSMNKDQNNSDEVISESEVYEIKGLSGKEINLEISKEKQDESLIVENSEIVCSFEVKNPQSESKVEGCRKENKQVQSEKNKNLSENDIAASEIANMDVIIDENSLESKSLQSDSKSEVFSSKNKSKEKKNLPENDNVVAEITDMKSLDSDIAVEKNSSQNHSPSSDGDDFNLDDDVIEEFANEENKIMKLSNDGIEELPNEENKIMKLSDDELDDLVEEFVEAECSSLSAENKESKSKDLSSESDDEMELLIEDFKAVDSDNDCFIVQDSNNVVVINDDNESVQPKKKSISNKLQSETDINSNNLSDKMVKNDAVSCSQDLIKKSETSAKVSENENIAEKENEIEVLNDEANIEKLKNVKIGFFKSEIFDNEVEENKQNNSNKLDKNDIEGMTEKNIVTASPLFEGLRGKVGLECRTDGMYLKKDNKNINLQSANTNDEKGNISNNADISNKVSNGYDILSKDQPVIISAKSNSLEEEQCMDDILKKVCASSDNNSTNNEECKSTAIKKKSELVNNSILLEENQIISQNGDIKSLGSLCNDTLEESKKRKLESLDNKSDESVKKIKTQNKAESNVVTAESSSSQIDASVRKKILDHFNEAFRTKVQLKKSWLEKMSKRLCRETLLEEYKEEIAKQKNLIKDLEDKLQTVKDDLKYSKAQVTTFTALQKVIFKKHQFAVQECDEPCTQPQPMPFPTVTKTEVSSNTKTEVPANTTVTSVSTPISSPASVKAQVPQLKTPAAPVLQTAASRKCESQFIMPQSKICVSSARLPAPNSVRFAPAPAPAPANAAATKKEVAPSLSNSQAVPPRPAVAQKSQPPTKACSQVIDLTDEESSSKKLMPASSTLVSLASNSKVNLPGLQNNQNVLLPINGLFQMLPAAAQNNSQFSISNPVQVQQVSRQALVPTLQPNLLGPRTVAYIIPTNSGQISSIGRNSLPVTNFVPGTNQRLQTLIVRVTNPGQVPPMSTAINSHARMPAPTHGLRAPTTRHPSIPSSSSSSDLVLFPRQPKHPAPFPALPEYRSSSQLKAIPPKPSLKGSRAPNGIILSWNMSLLSLHAEIANYQLFAYQEQPGPVNSSLWKKVGDVKALPLPMACTLTQFMDGNRYYFTVRAVDVHNRFGPYSDAVNILFTNIKDCKSLK
ncbi:activating transcription factor 7-interacting protein 1-like isoform X2 [Argiope bruennichi]|uniref:activating transcription factor 7-interacting protein 1-like isoform X2 n=1 Tax=Argiope bruennichi TaxID=94029 RepID=UPI0024940E94|nr:activating transcription factor 7-interacting protein 1-like isoform X2 [Argiope bruennichi]